FIIYFRFRKSDVGTEMYWSGLYDADNRENRRVKEAKRTIEDMKKINAVAGKHCICKVGILYKYDVSWDSENDIYLKPLEEISNNAWFLTLQKNHIPFDFIDFREDIKMEELQNYELIIAPHITMISEVQSEVLKAYTKIGGTLILGARSGYKNVHGHVIRKPIPGIVSDLIGGNVDEYTVLGPAEVGNEKIVWKDDGQKTVGLHMHEILNVDTAEVIAEYEMNYYKGSPALIKNTYEDGCVYYFGAAFSEDTANKLLDIIGLNQLFEKWIDLPWEAELCIRGDENYQYYFVLNYKPYVIEVHLKEKAYELIQQDEVCDTIAIEPYGVRVFKRTTI
ncbi:MAG: beta-galactosidase trimerization domain-containing protein, partial [Suipraeoptans sp.]